MKPDLFDALVAVGLAIGGAGAWMLSPAWSLIAVGAIVFALGIMGSR